MVRTGPRPAPPHRRFLKAASTEETKTRSGNIQNPAEPSTISESSPLQTTADSLPAMTDCAKNPSPATQNTVADHCKTASTGDPSPTTTTETVLRRRKSNSSKKSLTVAVIATGAEACPVSTTRCSSDSDGGVELPPHLDTTNARGIVFGGQVDDTQEDNHNGGPELDADSTGRDSSEPRTNSVTQDNPEPDIARITNEGCDSEPLLSVLDSLDCCNQS